MKKKILLTVFLFCSLITSAQLKYIAEDFEGIADGVADLQANGVFTFGNVKAAIDTKMSVHQPYSGERSVRITRSGRQEHSGWGKGVGMFVQLDASTDYFNFYLYQPASNGKGELRIELQEDDSGDSKYTWQMDDAWIYTLPVQGKNSWELISIPLRDFKDDGPSGDQAMNISYKDGKLMTILFSFMDKSPATMTASFDFLCFSKGSLPTGSIVFSTPPAEPGAGCALGAWSKEGNIANFTDIPLSFERLLTSQKKLGVVHFFQPFAVDGGTTQNFYPSVERVNKIIDAGYIPMITLEDHFVNSTPSARQPNLYSIIEGHFDPFFAEWAKKIREVKGTVLLRILHEFNGDWYPWCIVNNDRNPELVKKAYRHIHSIFQSQGVTNVKFIWCPNSMSIPQSSWNFIMDAYPGDDVVDIVALDVYNGAGAGHTAWRSFRKEAIENYFILTQLLAAKPMFICETASRERGSSDSGFGQNKAEWIMQMSEAVSTDMSKIKMLAWFNEKSTFRINSSVSAMEAFNRWIWKNDYFQSGPDWLLPQVK